MIETIITIIAIAAFLYAVYLGLKSIFRDYEQWQDGEPRD